MTERPEQQRFEQLCAALAARLEKAGITAAALQATLPQVRRQLMKRRYPKLFAANRRQSVIGRKGAATPRRKQGMKIE